jgi:myo-inositol-1(or 4)-monophosphatase
MGGERETRQHSKASENGFRAGSEAVDLGQASDRMAASVREAGALALSMFGRPIPNWTKFESSPVSDADIAVDRLLHERLRAADSAVAWLSEESVDDPSRLEARWLWIVDPIDGTRAYLAGLPDWSVSVALVDNGRPVAACLYAPVSDQFFMAIAGQGATCNGKPMAATAGASLERLRIAGPRKLVERLVAREPSFTIAPRMRSLALRLTQVAQGICDVAIAGPNSHDWDLAAADLLVHEAGSVLSPVGGDSVIYNRPVLRHGTLIAAGRDKYAAFADFFRDERLASS